MRTARILQWASAFILLPTAFLAQTNDAAAHLDSELNTELRGKVLTLRTFHEGRRLVFDANGQFLQGGKEGSWTLTSKVQVDEISSTPTALQVRVRRVAVVFEPSGAEGHLLTKDEVLIEIELPSAASADVVTNAVRKVFLGPGESLAALVSPAWHAFLEGKISVNNNGVAPLPEEALTADGRPLVNLKAAGSQPSQSKLSAPYNTFAPDPEYESFAKSRRYQGVTELWCVVNERGETENIKILRPIGLGLDDSAVEAVRRWKFEPAKRDGIPVPVQINIQVRFRLP